MSAAEYHDPIIRGHAYNAVILFNYDRDFNIDVLAALVPCKTSPTGYYPSRLLKRRAELDLPFQLEEAARQDADDRAGYYRDLRREVAREPRRVEVRELVEA